MTSRRTSALLRSLALACLLLAACAPRKPLRPAEVAGEYRYNGVYGIDARMTLDEDMRFNYGWKSGLNSGISTGTYEIDGRSIILQSDRQPEPEGVDHFRIMRTESAEADSLTVKVLDEEGQPIPFAVCILKKEGEMIAGEITGMDGWARLPRLKADSLILSFVGYKVARLSPDPEVSYYEIALELLGEEYRHFSRERWVFRKGDLYEPGSGSYSERGPYKRE